MGGKSGTTTQSVAIPKEVLARYNAVNSQAQSVAATPFQKYSTNPNDFVAGMNQQQYGGIGQINQAANMAQPSIAYAQQGLTGEGFQRGVQDYMNPYLQNAMGATAAQMQNVNQQQQNQLAGNAIQQGAFGGDRAGIARNNLINQQNLAMGQTLGNMANQGYQQSAQNYMQGLGQIGQLGLQGQQAALQGGQAMLGAGTLEQQTQQAGQTALYNQFLQQQAYPFQVAQFLANIAMGTGGLSGSTTTTTQPMPFFSDRRLKKNIERIGETDEGLPIHKFEYKGDPKGQKHIGLMADEVEQVHPEAVGLHPSGYKVVDYDRATSEGGAVTPQRAGLGFAGGGDVAAGLNAMNAMQANMPVAGGGVNPGLAAAAQAIAPQPNVPQSVFYEPSYNVFADPKYQPDLNGTNTGTNGKGNGHGDGHEGHHTQNDQHQQRAGGGDGYRNPFSQNNTSVDPNGVMYDNDGRPTGGYDPTQGPAYADGGRAGYNLGGYPQQTQQYNPALDPYSIENIINRQTAMYNNLAGHHVPAGRSLSGGIGKYGRVPESNLPVSQLKQAGSIPSLPESGFKQALGAATDTSDLFSKGKDLYKYYQDLKSKIPDVPADEEEKKARGGLVGFALGGDASEDIYKEQDTDATRRGIPTKFDKTKLQDPSKPPTPTSQTGLSMGDAFSIGKFILPFLLKNGGRAGYATNGSVPESYENIPVEQRAGSKLSKYEFGPYKFEPTQEQRKGVDPDLLDALQHGASSLRDGYHARFVSGKRGVNPEHPHSMHSVPGLAKAMDIEIVDPEGKGLPNYQDPRFFEPYHDVAKAALSHLEKKDPELAKRFAWGGLFSGPEGKYGAMDTMHYSFDEPMAGGTIKEGLNPQQAALWEKFDPNAPKRTASASSSSPSFLDSLADMVGFTKANAQEIKDKNRQGADSTDLLLSILSGVGTMAGSNSPYLGAAILQGIGGGAKTYAGLRGQALERGLAQQGVDISERGMDITSQAQGIQALKYLQSRFQPKYDPSGKYIVKYVDLNGGEVSVEQYGKIMQDAAQKLKLSNELVPQAGLGAATQGGVGTEGGLGGAYEPREDRAPSINSMLSSEKDAMVPVQGHGIIPLAHLTNPDKIQETINQLYGQLNSVIDPKMKDSISGAITRLEGSLTKITDIASQPQTVYDSITGVERKIPGIDYIKVVSDAARNPDGIATLPDGSQVMTGIPQYAAANKKLAEDNTNKAAEFVTDWKTTRNMLSSLAHVYSKGQAGPVSENWGLLNGIMKFFKLEPFDPKAGTTYDTALKTAMNLAIMRTSQFATGAPAAGIDASMIASPDPKKDPDALYKIITDTIGYGDMAYDRSQALLDTKPKDVMGFVSKFSKDPKNDPQKYIERARQETPAAKGSTKQGAEVTGTGVYENGPVSADGNKIIAPDGMSYRDIENLIRQTPKSKIIVLPDGTQFQGGKE